MNYYAELGRRAAKQAAEAAGGMGAIPGASSAGRGGGSGFGSMSPGFSGMSMRPPAMPAGGDSQRLRASNLIPMSPQLPSQTPTAPAAAPAATAPRTPTPATQPPSDARRLGSASLMPSQPAAGGKPPIDLSGGAKAERAWSSGPGMTGGARTMNIGGTQVLLPPVKAL